MQSQEYKNLIEKAPFAFAYHKIILDNNKKPIDYEFIEINEAFETLTGLEKSKTIGHKVTELVPEITKDPFNWISLYGEIALNGGDKEFEQYSQGVKRWYKVRVFSTEKYYFSTLFIDVSEEKEKNAELEGFLSVSLNLLCVFDLDGNLIKLNDEWENTLGYSIEELKGKKFFKIIHPNDKEKTFKAIEKLKNEKNLIDFVNRCLDKNGESHYIEWRANLKENNIYVAARDITENKKAEKALKESEKQFRDLFENAPIGVFHSVPKGHFIMANPALAKMLGYSSAEELIEKTSNMTTQIYVNPEERPKIIEELINYDGWINYEKILWYRKDRSIIVVKLTGRKVVNSAGELEYLEVFLEDITERNLAEEALKESEEQYKILFETAQEGIIVAQGNKLSYFNPMMLEITGYNSQELFDMDFIELVYSEDKNLILTNYRKRLTGKKIEQKYQFRIQKKDKSIIWCEISAVKLNWKGKPATLSFINDINEEKIAQQKLLETNKELELAKAKAESANKSKSEFLANMSHEIRTPLNGVIGFTDLLFGTSLNAIQQQYVENANISAHSLLGIINDILDFSKIEAGKMELDFVKTDIIELIEKTCDIIKYQASQKGIELLLDIQPDMPQFAIIDPIRLKQILVNLLGNSVKFTEVGEIELKVSFIPQNKSSGFFTFSVLDTGIGIDSNQQKKLFDAFTQADLSTTRKFGGTGLGLTISNMLAKKMRSNIEVISELKKGSVFYFTIETEYEFGEKLDFNTLKDIKKVLLVDDNLSNSLILQKTFDYFNIDFHYVNSALEAVRILEQNNNFDIIIIDYHMPNLNGLDLIRMMKKHSLEEKNIILLHNSSDDIKIYDEAKKLGVRFNLTKPIKNQELFSSFKEIKKASNFSKEESQKTTDFIVTIEDNKLPVVLIAEDVSMNMLLLKTIIKQIVPHVKILEAKNGKEALDLVISTKPDLVFMDVQMPEMNGIEATKEIRNDDYYKNIEIPIVALTAGALKEEKEKCLEAGMNDFLTKPIEQKELYEILKKYLT